MTRTVGKLALLALVASLFGGSMSQAALIPTATLVKDPNAGVNFSAPDAALPSPWVSWKLSIVATAGEIVQAAQVNMTGVFHQRWTDADADEVPEPTPNSAAASGLTNGDTHLLAPTGSLFGSGPAEDNTMAGSPLASTPTAFYGTGTFLQGAWSVLVPSSTTNLAYIVIKRGSVPNMNIDVRVANPTGQIIGTFTTSDFIGQIPEPTTVTLAGLGLIGMLGLARRRS